MNIDKIIRCKYCKENVRVGLVHDCKTGRRQASSYDHYYDGSCRLGTVLGAALLLDDEPCAPAIDTTTEYSCPTVTISDSCSDSSSGDSSSCSWSE